MDRYLIISSKLFSDFPTYGLFPVPLRFFCLRYRKEMCTGPNVIGKKIEIGIGSVCHFLHMT